MSRRTKFDPKTGLAIAKLVSLGVPLEAAAQAEGISKSTLYNWRRAGEAGRAPFRQFSEDLDKALAAAEVSITLNVVRASRDDWRAGAWWLERRNPALEQKLQSALQQFIEELRPNMSEAAYAELIQAIAKVMGVTELGAESAAALVADTPTQH